MCSLFILRQAFGCELCLEFIWLENKLLKVVVTSKSLSLICCPAQFTARLKERPRAV